MRRGEVYFVDFGKDKMTHKQCGIRPAVIVSNNRGNGHGPKNCFRFRGDIIELSLINVNWTGKNQYFL